MSVVSPFTPGSWLASDGRWYPSRAHPDPLPGTGESDSSGTSLAPDSPGALNDADLLDTLNEAQRTVHTHEVTHRHDAWRQVVRLMRELRRRYPPAPLATESPDDGGDEHRTSAEATSSPEVTGR